MIVNEQREVKLINCCNAIYAENELINAALWYSDKPICSTNYRRWERVRQDSIHAGEGGNVQ